MAVRKTTGEMIAEIEKKQEQMNARKKQLLKREAAENRKVRKPEGISFPGQWQKRMCRNGIIMKQSDCLWASLTL